MPRTSFVLAVSFTAVLAGTASAQSLGTFRWQLLPFCNVVSAAVTQNGAVYRIEGTDDQCQAGAEPASVVGMAFPRSDGSIGFGFTVVSAPGGGAVHVEATIALPGLSGTWRDSAGGRGTFVFTPGAAAPGPIRPLPVNPVPLAIHLNTDGSLVARGTEGQGSVPASGPGVRMLWYPGRAAFRAGKVDGSEWDEAQVGPFSTAFGWGSVASGFAATAVGEGPVASGRGSLAVGILAQASGEAALAAGHGTRASGSRSTAVGSNASTNLRFGSFVYGDASTVNSGAIVTSDANNQFMVRAAGGYKLFSNAATTTGVLLAPNASAWSSLSDRHSKHRFEELDGDTVLGKLAAMPIQEWSYKAQDAAVRHVGPTAQDFHAAFGLGEDPLRISTIDADGIALAAARALEARTRAQADELSALRVEVGALRRLIGTLTVAPR